MCGTRNDCVVEDSLCAADLQRMDPIDARARSLENGTSCVEVTAMSPTGKKLLLPRLPLWSWTLLRANVRSSYQCILHVEFYVRVHHILPSCGRRWTYRVKLHGGYLKKNSRGPYSGHGRRWISLVSVGVACRFTMPLLISFLEASATQMHILFLLPVRF